MSVYIEQIIEIAVQAGSLVLENGGETYRAEETCVRMARSMGARAASAFVTPTLVMVTVQDKDHRSHTAMRRITARTVNLRKIALVNDLSRRLVQRGFNSDLALVSRMLERIDHSPDHSFWSLVVMGGFTGFFFGLRFGCSFSQAICAFVVGFLLRMFLLWIGKFNLNSFILSVMSGGFISIACQLIYVLGIVPQSVQMMTAALMQVVPGLALVNSIRDLIAGDLMAGTARLVDAFMVATGLSVGSVVGLLVFSHVVV